MTPIEELRLAYLTQQEAHANMMRCLTAVIETQQVAIKNLENMIAELGDRFQKLEVQLGCQFDANILSDEQLQILGENMYHRGSLRETIGNAVENAVANEIEDQISKYLENVDVEVECSAYLKDRN